MGFANSSDNNGIDYERLRRDLINEYGAQMEKLGYGVASKMTVTEH